MDPGQLEEGSSQLGESNKRKAKGDPTSSSFKVTRVWIKKKRTFSLRMVKPDIQSEVGADNITYPTVCLMEESADNEHGFHIMHNIDHKNILSMEILCENKVQSNDTASVATFVEPYEGLLWSRCAAPSCADQIYHIPSSRLQSYLRQIVMGLDFLRINDLYHGDLSWNSTLYHGDTVKLAGFRSKEPMSKAEAQWDDWLCFLQMLEEVSNQAAQANETRSQDDKYYCGHLDSLINMMKRLDRTSLPIIKDIILEDYFFWDSARRHKFFMNTVSLKLTDTAFMKRLSKSSIRGKSWDTNCKSEFKLLVETMNEYREAQKKKSHKDRKGKDPEDENVEAYNGDSLRDYVRLVCGAYTHWRQIKVDVDFIIRDNHPTVCSDVKKILEASDSEDSPKGTNQFGGYGPQGYHPQDHGVASHYSESQSGYSCYPGPPSRGSKAWDQRPGSSAHASYKGGVSDSYEHGCSQLPSYRPGPGDNLGMENLSIHGYGQSQVPPGYGQPLDPQHAISRSYYGPQHALYYGPRHAFYYDPQHEFYYDPQHEFSQQYNPLQTSTGASNQCPPPLGYHRQSDPYARPTYSGPGHARLRGAPWYGPLPQLPHSYGEASSYGPLPQQPHAYGEAYGAVAPPYEYDQQGGEAPAPYGHSAPAAPGYAQGGTQHPGYGPTARPGAGGQWHRQ